MCPAQTRSRGESLAQQSPATLDVKTRRCCGTNLNLRPQRAIVMALKKLPDGESDAFVRTLGNGLKSGPKVRHNLQRQ